MNGPYRYFSDPQYVGTSLSLAGTAIYYQSVTGYILAIDMYIIFWISVMFFEVNERARRKNVGQNGQKTMDMSVSGFLLTY